MKWMSLIFSLLISSAYAAVEVGKPLPSLSLAGEEGGKVDGSPFDSENLKGKTLLIFYVDPEERKQNEPLEKALKEDKLPFEKHTSIAIINMAAAWYPNTVLNSQLKSKQEEFPNTVYVKDMKKKVVSTWGLGDDAVNLVVVDPKGTVIYLKKNAIETSEFTDLIKLIRKSFN